MQAKAPREILVIKPSSLGDIVHTLPAVALIKRQWPEARLLWLINTEWAPLIEGNPQVDEVIPFPRQELRGGRGLTRWVPWARGLRGRVQADLVLDFQGLLRSAVLARICLAKGGRIIGLSDSREGARLFHHQTIPVDSIDHAVDRNLALVASLGIPVAKPLEWPLPLGTAPAGFTEAPPFVLLHPFSRGSGKSLKPGDLTAFCRVLAPTRVVLAGQSDETALPAENLENFLNRTTLAELIWLIRHAAYVVSVDSGPMHIAAAFTPRLVAIHTWSDPRHVGPHRSDAWVWQDGALIQVKDLGSPRRRQPVPTIVDLAQHVARQLEG